MLPAERLAGLMERIDALEREATTLAAASTEDCRCRADLLRASLLGTRASLDLVSDAAALTDAEGVIAEVGRHLAGLERSK